MNLLFTGASGFLGTNIRPILAEWFSIETVGLSQNDDYCINISENIPVLNKKYDVVLHAAGKAHMIPKTEDEKQIFFKVNLEGTKNLCNALEKIGVPKAFIFVSTVAVYGCESGEWITEDHPLNGDTPYALSKRYAEEFLENWCVENKVKLSIIRPSLLAGPNPPGNLGAMINGIRSGRYFSIAGGKARKSVLMVEDIARLVPLLIQKGGIYNVCDDSQPSFGEIERLIAFQLGKRKVFTIPFWLAKVLALAGDCLGKKSPINSSRLSKMTATLTFSNNKAKTVLNWQPLDVLSNFRIQ